MTTLLLHVEREWALIDKRKFGVGNISLAGGARYDKHNTHKLGLEVDVRPIRKDGRHESVYWYQPEQYDQTATGLVRVNYLGRRIDSLFLLLSRSCCLT